MYHFPALFYFVIRIVDLCSFHVESILYMMYLVLTGKSKQNLKTTNRLALMLTRAGYIMKCIRFLHYDVATVFKNEQRQT